MEAMKFLGYARYVWANKFARICNIFPLHLRNLVSKILNTFPTEKINKFNELFSTSLLPTQLGDRIKKIGKILLSKSNYEIYIKLITQMEDKVLLNQTDLHSHQKK